VLWKKHHFTPNRLKRGALNVARITSDFTFSGLIFRYLSTDVSEYARHEIVLDTLAAEEKSCSVAYHTDFFLPASPAYRLAFACWLKPVPRISDQPNLKE
jgi:hypothetical protein